MNRTSKTIIGVLAVAAIVIVAILLLRAGTNEGGGGAARNPPPGAGDMADPRPTAPPAFVPDSDIATESATASDTEPERPGDVALAAGASDAGSDPPRDTGEWWIVGTIADADGLPIAGATVTLFVQDLRMPVGWGGSGRATLLSLDEVSSARTNDAGRYEAPFDGSLPLAVRAEASGFAPGQAILSPASAVTKLDTFGRRVVTADFTLEPSSPFAGRVVDDVGEPVGDVLVRLRMRVGLQAGWLENTIETETRTDERGDFAFESARMPPFSMRLSKSGYAVFQYDVEEIGDRDWILPRGGGSIRGTVVLLESGEPVAGAIVRAFQGKPPNSGNDDPVGVSVHSAEDGTFSLEPLQAAFWDITAEKDGMRHLASDSPLSVRVALGEQETVDGVTLRLAGGFTIRGRVIDGATGQPVGGAEVREEMGGTPGVFASSAVDGRFVLANVFGRNGFRGGMEVKLVAARDGYAPGEAVVVPLVPGREPAEADIAIWPTVLASGVVRDLRGSPVAGVPVRMHDRTGASPVEFTDERGRFELPARVRATLQIKALPSPDLSSYSEPFETSDADVEGIEVVLDPGGTVEVLAIDENGAPIAEADASLMVRAQGRDGWSSAMRIETGKTGESGIATFERIPSAKAVLPMDLSSWSPDFFASHEDYEPAREDGVAVGPGETKRIELTLSPRNRSAYIEGFATDWKDDPVEGVIVQAQRNPGDWGEGVTDPLGYFRIEDLAPGDYTLASSHPDFLVPRSDPVAAPCSDVRIRFDRPNTTFVLTVLDSETKAPVSGAEAVTSLFARPSGADGRIVLRGIVPARPEECVVEHADYESRSIAAGIPEGLRAGETTVELVPLP